MSCSAIEAGLKEEEGEDVQSVGICLPKKPLCLMSPALLEVAERLPADGKW